MKLTDVLFRWKKALPGGHLWKGKHRLYKKVTPKIKAAKLNDFAVEEMNMFYLRHPYLTVEQSRGHAKSFNHHAKFLEEKRLLKLEWRKDKLLGDRFGFLKVSDKWE